MSNIPEDLVQPDFTEMVDHGHIGVFENFLRWEFCDKVVEAFEFWYNKKHIKRNAIYPQLSQFIRFCAV